MSRMLDFHVQSNWNPLHMSSLRETRVSSIHRLITAYLTLLLRASFFRHIDHLAHNFVPSIVWIFYLLELFFKLLYIPDTNKTTYDPQIGALEYNSSTDNIPCPSAILAHCMLNLGPHFSYVFTYKCTSLQFFSLTHKIWHGRLQNRGFKNMREDFFLKLHNMMISLCVEWIRDISSMPQHWPTMTICLVETGFFRQCQQQLEGAWRVLHNFFSFQFLWIFSQLVLAISYKFFPLVIFYFSRSPSKLWST